jgi:hypothetical protein
MRLWAGVVPLTQLRVRLGFASPTLRNPLPHWGPIGGEGRVRGLLAQRAISSRGVGRPAGEELAMTGMGRGTDRLGDRAKTVVSKQGREP